MLVAAGPGSGKTRLLVSWIDARPDSFVAAPGRILALTFTNRAAAELSDRLGVFEPRDCIDFSLVLLVGAARMRSAASFSDLPV